jgi:hypothetical protein
MRLAEALCSLPFVGWLGLLRVVAEVVDSAAELSDGHEAG